MSKQKFFGTDGVRGRANEGKMTPMSAMALGHAAGRYFRRHGQSSSVVIGKDTRLSGYMLEPALVAGFTSMGMNVKLTGPLPTPAVSLMTRTLRADMGVMITASHNKFYDNGIKLFGPDGCKLSDAAEAEIEDILLTDSREKLSDSTELGRVTRYDDMQARYLEITKATFPRQMRLTGLKIVIDCANGAAYKTAPATLWELGAEEVYPIGIAPNGTNINDGCGSTDTALLSKTVLEKKAHVGIALDGDADRLIMCDEKGRIIDGDQLLALIGSGWQDSGLLTKPGIVATVMSNLGLERFVEGRGMEFIRTSVGDRNVSARMLADGYNLGGEQSGHILMTDFTPTGDGTVAALQVLREIVRSGRPASEVLNQFETVPQMLKNIRYDGISPMEHPELLSAIKDAKADFGTAGRVLVRASGTESLIRVMAEGDDAGKVDKITDDLVALIAKLAA